MSPNARRLASILGAALLLGVGGNLLFGASPAAVKPVVVAELPWQPVGMRVPDLATADQVWEARAPWGAVPKPVEPPPPPPPPPPVPVGIVGTGNAREAIFLVAGAGELRLGVGGTLPDGGRVLEVSAMKVAWTDGAGQNQERRMFTDPVELPASAGAGAGVAASAGFPGAVSAPGPAGPPGPAGRSQSRRAAASASAPVPGAASAPADAAPAAAPAAPAAPPRQPRGSSPSGSPWREGGPPRPPGAR